VESLCQLFAVLGNSLDLEETLATLDSGLQEAVSYDSITVHVPEGAGLSLAYTANRGRWSGAGRSRLETPIENAGKLVALVSLYRELARPFSAQDRAFLRALAPKLAAAVANARLYQRAKELAEIDTQTGLLNARGLFQCLDAELARARRSQGRLAVIHCTVDRLGASEASEGARIQIAAALRQACREYDYAARSGDDLVLVLADFRPQNLPEKQAGLDDLVREAGREAGHQLGVRMGAAFFPEDGADAESLLATAAKRLAPRRHV